MPEVWHGETDQAREHRAGAWLLLLVGLIGFGLGVFHIRNRIIGSNTPESSFKTLDEVERERIESLKTKDADADEISDFDETYVFKTSPFLSDSDSDGIDDKKELAAGTNPNCPEGKDCGLIGAAVADTVAAEPTAGDSGVTDADRAYIEQLLNPTPAQVREFLIQAGAKDEDLKDIDDETLLKLYQEALQEAEAERSKASGN